MRNRIVFFVILGLLATFAFLYTPQTGRKASEPCLVNPRAKGTIIILNGVSSIGKSSIQKELQDIMDEPYVAIGIDKMLVGTLPSRCFTGDFLATQAPSNGVEGLHGYYEGDENERVYKLEFGPVCRNLVRGMHRAFAALADERNNLVIDYILYDQQWLPDLVDALYGYDVYFIGLKAPLDVIERREKKRNTSPEGHARAYYDEVHKHKEYDVILDTSDLTPQEAALAIKEYVGQHTPKAFNTLYKEFIR